MMLIIKNILYCPSVARNRKLGTRGSELETEKEKLWNRKPHGDKKSATVSEP